MSTQPPQNISFEEARLVLLDVLDSLDEQEPRIQAQIEDLGILIFQKIETTRARNKTKPLEKNPKA